MSETAANPQAAVAHKLSDGREVHEITIEGHGLTAKILTLGAVLRDLRLEGHAPSLVLGYEDVSSYIANEGCFGAIVGRYANRIKSGRFKIDGQSYQVEQNHHGNALHGGSDGTWAQIWNIAAQGADFVTLSLSLPDGHMGYPGRLNITCTYRLIADATLDLQIAAESDAPTLCNLAPHGYFNLDGHATISKHLLELPSDQFVPVDSFGIPLGHVETTNPSLDFRKSRAADSADLDHNFCYEITDRSLQTQARLRSTATGRSLEVRSNQAGIQLFNAASLRTTDNGHDGRPYGPFCGIAFEPQIWPDAPNHAGFPDAVLRPGGQYLNHSQFIFA